MIASNAPVPILPAPVVPGTFPTSTCNTTVSLLNGAQQTLAPGCYSQVTVHSNGKLTFGAHHYFVKRLQVEPGGKLTVQSGTVVDVRDGVTFRGSIIDASGNPAALDLRFRGVEAAFVEASFKGAILAPTAGLVLGGANGQVMTGHFYGKTVEVRSGVNVIADPSVVGTYGIQRLRPEFPEQDQDAINAVADVEASVEAVTCSAAGAGARHQNTSWLAATFLGALAVSRLRRARNASRC